MGHLPQFFQCELHIMRMRVLCRLTALLLALAFLSERVAFAIPTPDAASAKHQIEARGIGAGVKVKQAGGKTSKGTVISIEEQSFTFQEKGKAPESIPFANLASVSSAGMTRGAKIGLGLGIGSAVLVALLIIGAAHTPPNWN
ncbi:MAG: hypothetical protein NVS9B15_26160 [Acidobacteriaceae bacterium]